MGLSGPRVLLAEECYSTLDVMHLIRVHGRCLSHYLYYYSTCVLKLRVKCQQGYTRLRSSRQGVVDKCFFFTNFKTI